MIGLAAVLSLIIVGVIVAVLVAVIFIFRRRSLLHNKDSSVPEQTNGTLHTCTLCVDIRAPFQSPNHTQSPGSPHARVIFASGDTHVKFTKVITRNTRVRAYGMGEPGNDSVCQYNL